MTIIDIGGQDNKIIRVADDGGRIDFKMNRKCAAGTGAFLEEIARRIEVPLGEMEGLARQSTELIELGSFCTVFTATEILALVRRGAAVTDIVKGAFRAVAKRVIEMAPLDGALVATGGVVAHNPIVVELLTEMTGVPVETPPDPQFSGALGAALFARDESES
jgi:predicted CoA-substrate-specific enzyme activase